MKTYEDKTHPDYREYKAIEYDMEKGVLVHWKEDRYDDLRKEIVKTGLNPMQPFLN